MGQAYIGEGERLLAVDDQVNVGAIYLDEKDKIWGGILKNYDLGILTGDAYQISRCRMFE